MLQYNYQLYGSQELGNPNNTQSYIDLLNEKSIRATEPDLYEEHPLEEIQDSDTIDRRKFDQLENNILSSRRVTEDPFKFDPIQYRTQKQSRDFSRENNLIRQIRVYKAARLTQGRFLSMPCEAGLLKIRNKKLCSPITCKTMDNEEIP